MKYALVNNERQEAQKGLSGKCPSCGHTTIARCGKVKIPHWAHKGKLICDPWWEETAWHRDWKDRFPKDWQEIPCLAENGEKHIADVKTDQEYVIEFQHSQINPEERQTREDFYKKMIWIVDGTTRQKDKDKFFKCSEPFNNNIVRRLRNSFDECALLRDWSNSKTAVFFDFDEDILWVFLPKTIEKRYVFSIRGDLLIASLCATRKEFNFEGLLNAWITEITNSEKPLRRK